MQLSLPITVRTLRQSGLGLAISFLGGLLSGCTPSSREPLRLGINGWPGYEFLYLAQKKGFYEAEGVNVRLVEFSSLSDSRRGYERGQVDALACTSVEVLQARDLSRRSPQIVWVVDYSNGGDVILTRPGATNAAQLRGAKVGVELASLGLYVLARGLEKHGLTLSDVTPVSLDQMSMSEAFAKGEIDVAVTYPPTSVSMQRDGKAQIAFSSAEIPGEVIDVLAVDEEVFRNRKDDVRKLLAAFARALRYAEQNPEDAYRIMAQRERLSPEEFRNLLQDGIRIVRQEEQKEYFQPGGHLERILDVNDLILRQTGQIKNSTRKNGAYNHLSQMGGKEGR